MRLRSRSGVFGSFQTAGSRRRENEDAAALVIIDDPSSSGAPALVIGTSFVKSVQPGIALGFERLGSESVPGFTCR